MLRCLALRGYPSDGWPRTKAGDSLLHRVHKLSVERALDDGKDVPDAVRVEYGYAKSPKAS